MRTIIIISICICFVLFDNCMTNNKESLSELDSNLKELAEKGREGDINAQFKMGEIFYNLAQSTNDRNLKPALYNNAKDWLDEASKNGHLEAQYILADIYKTGASGSIDCSKALELLIKSASNGYFKSQFELYNMYNDGMCVNKNIVKSQEWLNKAEFSNSAFFCAKYYLDNDFTKAKKFCEDSANSGNPSSQYIFGMMLLNGIGIKKDCALASKWLKNSADKNFTEAKFQLGRIYLDGFCVKKNNNIAFKYLNEASKDKNGRAQLLLSKMYFEGEGVEEDYLKAKEFCGLACENGVNSACELYSKFMDIENK